MAVAPKGYAGEIPVYCAFDEIVCTDDLVKNPKNPNRHPEYQIEMLGNIIKSQGWRQPIKVSKRSGYIVSGHGRYEAALFIGAESVPVDYQEYSSDEEELADLLADNRIAELAEMDNKMLADIFAEVDGDSFDLELTGYTFEDIEDLLTDNIEPEIDLEKADEDLPDVPDEPFTQEGDVWHIGKHRLICGDSTDIKVYEKLLGEEKAKLIVTDPPYNVDYEGSAGKIQNDNMASDEFKEFMHKVYDCLSKSAEPGAGIYVFHADIEGITFRREFERAGFLLKQCLVWVKNTFVLGRQDYQWQHEPCLYGWKDGAAHYFTDSRKNCTVLNKAVRPDFSKMDKEELQEFLDCLYDDFEEMPSSVIYCDKPTKNELHPTMKPVKLIAKLVENSSKAGWIVLDSFGGSGSTLIASEATGRICRTIELDPKFCDVIVKRYISVTGKDDVTLLRGGKEIPLNETSLI